PPPGPPTRPRRSCGRPPASRTAPAGAEARPSSWPGPPARSSCQQHPGHLMGLGQVGYLAGDEVGPEERLADADQREGERLWVESELQSLALPRFDEDVAECVDDPVLLWACLGGHHAQRALRFGLDEPVQRLELDDQVAEPAVDGEHPGGTAPLGFGAGLRQTGRPRRPDPLAGQLVAAADPAVQGGPADAELLRELVHVEPLAAQEGAPCRLQRGGWRDRALDALRGQVLLEDGRPPHGATTLDW